MATYTAIVEDGAGNRYAVRDADGISQSWAGIPVKPAAVVGYAPKGRNPRERLVRKAGCHILSRSHTTRT